MEPVSPELVLVDSALAEGARRRLPQPDDTLARLDALVQTSRMTSLARRSMDVPRRRVPGGVEDIRRISRLGHRRSAALAGAVSAGALAIALLLGVRVDLNGTSAGADTTAIEETRTAPVPRPPIFEDETQSPPRGAAPPSATNPAPQRFAWAPTPGASAYHVEIFRGSSKVFAADTTRPALTTPVSWVFAGRRQTLEPGNYRWYVWPVTSGTRDSRAVVQATLVVTAR